MNGYTPFHQVSPTCRTSDGSWRHLNSQLDAEFRRDSFVTPCPALAISTIRCCKRAGIRGRPSDLDFHRHKRRALFSVSPDQRLGLDDDQEATPIDQTGQGHQDDPGCVVRAPRLDFSFDIERQLLAKKNRFSAERRARLEHQPGEACHIGEQNDDGTEGGGRPNRLMFGENVRGLVLTRTIETAREASRRRCQIRRLDWDRCADCRSTSSHAA